MKAYDQVHRVAVVLCCCSFVGKEGLTSLKRLT